MWGGMTGAAHTTEVPVSPDSHCGESVMGLQSLPAVIQEDPETTAALTASIGADTLTCHRLLQNREDSARDYTSNGTCFPL